MRNAATPGGALMLLLTGITTSWAQTPSTPPRDFSRVHSYSGTVQITGSGSRTDTQGISSTNERATLQATIPCLPGPPDCLAVAGGGAFLQGSVNGPLFIDQEHVLFQPFGPPSISNVRANGNKTGAMSLVVAPFTSVLTSIADTYGFQYDHTFQCQTVLNGQVTGTDLCFYGPKIPLGQSPFAGPSMVGNVPLPAFGFTFSGALPNRHPDDPFNGSYNIQWDLQCDARTLTLPVLRQYALPWKTDLLNNKAGKTIGAKGCTLTALAMALTFAGYAHTPRTLNEFMIANGGYSGNNGVRFAQAVNRASAGRAKFVAFQSTSTRDIEDVLCMGFPVILGVSLNARGEPGHYVVVTGKQGAELLINDPGFPDFTRLSQWSSFVTRGFLAPKEFSARRPLAPDTVSPNDSVIAVHADGEDIDLMIVDSSGRRTGFDPSSGSVLQEIPGSVYFRDAISDVETGQPSGQSSRYLQIDRATQGLYQVVITGQRQANYAIGVDTYAQDGTQQTPGTVQGSAQLGASVLSLQYNAAPGATSQVGAPGCAWVSGSIPVLPNSGGTASLTVTATPGCAWTASSDANWLLIASGANGSGNGIVNLQALANSTNNVRSTKVRVAGITFTVTQRRTAQVFNDVAVTYPFFDAINLVLERHITDGCATAPLRYCPDAGITRGQMAVFIVRSLLGDNFTFPATPSFTDVPSGAAPHPFFKYIQKMKDLGITSGCTATQYCPDAPVTRGQMAVFIMRAKFGAANAFPYPPGAYFRDSGGLHLFYTYIQKMRELGVTSGCTATDYCPDAPVTRGQMAIFLTRGLFNEPGI